MFVGTGYVLSRFRNVPCLLCGPIKKQYFLCVAHGNHRQWTNSQSDARNVHERVFLPEQCNHVWDCQVLLEINNRIYLSTTDNEKSIAFLVYSICTGNVPYVLALLIVLKFVNYRHYTDFAVTQYNSRYVGF